MREDRAPAGAERGADWSAPRPVAVPRGRELVHTKVVRAAQAPRVDGLVGRGLDRPELGKRRCRSARVQQHACATIGVRRERALRGLPVAEAPVLDEDRLRALPEL